MAAKSASPEARQILTEIGVRNLPPDWDTVRVEDLLSDDRGIAVGVMYPGDHDPAGIPLIRAGDLNESRINPRPAFRITPAKHHEYRRTELTGGELLISLVGDVGRCALVPRHMAGWNAARAIAVLRFKNPSDAAFVRSCLMSSPLQHLMQAWSTTTVQATLNLKEIRQIPLPWPSTQERDAIAHILGALGDKIELNRKMNETLEAMARALFESWFVRFDPVHAKSEGRDLDLPKSLADLFPARLVDSELGEIPEGWVVARFADTVDIVGGGTPKTSIAGYWDGDIPWFSVVDAPNSTEVWVVDTKQKVTRVGVENSSTRVLPVGTTIISARGTVGRIALVGVPMAMNQSCYGLRDRTGAKGFFNYFATRELIVRLQQHAHGSVFDTITHDTLAGVSVVTPPAKLIDEFEKRVGSILERIRAAVLETRIHSVICDTLVPRLISGELRVMDAERLLESVS